VLAVQRVHLLQRHALGLGNQEEHKGCHDEDLGWWWVGGWVGESGVGGAGVCAGCSATPP
jgi:hypothetical protein